MNKIISGLPQVYCYLDDIIIISEDREKQIQLLRKVFKRLQEHGLVVEESKCIVAVDNLSFWGYLVSSSGFARLPSKVATVREFQLPRIRQKLFSSFTTTPQFSR